MKRPTMLGLTVALAIFLGLVVLDRPSEADGEVLCTQMAGCTSPNGCDGGIISVENCVMECASGGSVACDKIIVGGE